MQLMKSKRGAGIMDLAGALIGFTVVAVVAVVAFLINAGLRSQTTADSYAYNATTTVNTSMKTVTDFLPLIAVVLIGGFIIAYLVRGFGAKSGGV